MIYHINQRFYVTVALGESVALLVARRTNNQPTIGRLQVRVCITVLTGSRMGWTARSGRSPLLLPSCRKLELRLSALMDSDLAWVNGKSGRQSWRYADAFQRSIISEAIYHFTLLTFCVDAYSTDFLRVGDGVGGPLSVLVSAMGQSWARTPSRHCGGTWPSRRVDRWL